MPFISPYRSGVVGIMCNTEESYVHKVLQLNRAQVVLQTCNLAGAACS